MKDSGFEDSLRFRSEGSSNKGIRSQLPETMSPPETGNPCVPAIGLTNERSDSVFIQKLKDYKPSGIIYGVGAGNIFTMVKGFSTESPPKGLIMVDVNPAVILAAKILVNGFNKHDNWRDFAVNVLFTRKEERKQQIDNVLMVTEAEIRKTIGEEAIERFNQGMEDVIHAYYMSVGKGNWLFDSPSKYKEDKLGDSFSPILVIAQNYSLLHKLAEEGNMVVVYGDLFNQDLLKRIAELPGIKEANNIIYTSNIAEVSMHLVDLESEEWQEWFNALNSRFKSLNILKSNKPHKNIFVQTKLSREMSSKKPLTIRSTPPTFKKKNFGYLK